MSPLHRPRRQPQSPSLDRSAANKLDDRFDECFSSQAHRRRSARRLVDYRIPGSTEPLAAAQHKRHGARDRSCQVPATRFAPGSDRSQRQDLSSCLEECHWPLAERVSLLSSLSAPLHTHGGLLVCCARILEALRCAEYPTGLAPSRSGASLALERSSIAGLAPAAMM